MASLLRSFITFSLFCLSHAGAMQLSYNPEDAQRAKAGDKHLAGAQLYGITLEDVDLSNADLTDADLSNASLKNVNLKNAKFIRTNMKNVFLDHSNLDDALLDHADVSDSLLRRCLTRNTHVIDTNFSNAKLNDTRFFRSTLTNVNFTGASFENDCSFHFSHLTNINMQNSHLQCFTICSCSVNNINFQKAHIELSEFMILPLGENWEETINKLTWKNVNLSQALIIDCWFLGNLLLLFDKEQRVPELKELEPSWLYKLSVILNPLHTAKRMLSSNCAHNINSVLLGANFEEAQFIGVEMFNIALKDCRGIDWLTATESCLLQNVVAIDAQKKIYNISNA
jgi:uncharacterized protein YjbI with pentapeptide repeats